MLIFFILGIDWFGYNSSATDKQVEEPVAAGTEQGIVGRDCCIFKEYNESDFLQKKMHGD